MKLPLPKLFQTAAQDTGTPEGRAAFVHIVLHELREPLTPIFMVLPELRAQLPADQQELIDICEREMDQVQIALAALQDLLESIAPKLVRTPCPFSVDDNTAIALVETELDLRERLRTCICGETKNRLTRYATAVSQSRVKLTQSTRCTGGLQ